MSVAEIDAQIAKLLAAKNIAAAVAVPKTATDEVIRKIVVAYVDDGRQMAIGNKVYAHLHAHGITKDDAIRLVEHAYQSRTISKRFAKGKGGKSMVLLADANVIAWAEPRETPQAEPAAAKGLRAVLGLSY